MFNASNLLVSTLSRARLSKLNILKSSVVYLNNDDSKCIVLVQSNNKYSSINCIPINKKLLNLTNNIHNKQAILNINIMTSKLNANENVKQEKSDTNDKEDNKQKSKKPSKFKTFYKQYGPMFLVVHLTTVVLWIYVFFLISKQGYDITQLLVLFEKMGLMSQETVESIHYKIENYKPEKLNGYITGNDIKHFVTAYMVYKVIAPFRYMVSIALTRAVVMKLRQIGLFKR